MSGNQEDKDGITADGKYLLISVPEFGPDPVGDNAGKQMTSFLRLGAFHEQWKAQPGADLAEKVYAYPGWQGGHLNPDYGGEVSEEGCNEAFLDDIRNRDGHGENPSKDFRKEQSNALFTRGGWWDHSDGNRVTTTRGDKVEVIRGNYKLVVLGRQDEPECAATLDASGGVIADGGYSMDGASMRAEYRQDKYSGVWHLENATLGFIQTDDFAGDQFEHWWGEKKYSTIGSEEGEVEKAGKKFPNPHILEKTWAEKIQSYTGSRNRRIPKIEEETWAEETYSKTDVSGDSTDETYCGGKLKSTTGSLTDPVPEIEEATYALAMNSRTHAVAVNDFTSVGGQMETTIAGVLGSLTITPLNEEVTLNLHHGNIEVALMANDFFLGMHYDLKVGRSRELKVGSHEDTSFPDKKKKKLKELDAALDRLWMTLNDTHVSQLQKNLALSLHLNGMQVAIGM